MLKIALIAQDSKKELMVQFCNAYKAVLSKHKLCATSATGKIVANEINLPVTKFLSGEQGGYQQISSLISCGEIDMVIFFRDAMHPERCTKCEEDLMRLCDVHIIPIATNIATAEILLHGLERGDLDWRELGCPVL